MNDNAANVIAVVVICATVGTCAIAEAIKAPKTDIGRCVDACITDSCKRTCRDVFGPKPEPRP